MRVKDSNQVHCVFGLRFRFIVMIAHVPYADLQWLMHLVTHPCEIVVRRTSKRTGPMPQLKQTSLEGTPVHRFASHLGGFYVQLLQMRATFT